LRTVFLGTSEFAAAVLHRLADSPHTPVLVVTKPDRPRGRGRHLASPPVAALARALGLDLDQPASVNSADARRRIASVAPDVVCVCAFGALIAEPLLSAHPMLNVHPSLLPRWRGAAPIERAIMAGDTRTGVSIMRLAAGLDDGPVGPCVAEPIGSADTFASLSTRLQVVGAELLVRFLDEPEPMREQADQGVTYAEKIGASDRLLDPSRPAVELERTVRALHPHVGAHVPLGDRTLLGVQGAALSSPGEAADASSAGSTGSARGTPPLYADGDRLLLCCAPGLLELLVVQPSGRRPMAAADFLRGRGLPRSPV